MLEIIRKLLFLIVYLVLAGCSQSSPDIFTSEPMPQVKATRKQNINLELQIFQNNGLPLTNTNVTLSTQSFSDQGTTNSEGIVNLISQRENAEPLIFTFNGEQISAKEKFSQLPTTIENAEIVFEMISSSKVRISHYSVDGLYR